MTDTFRVKQFVKGHDLVNRLHAHIWLLETYAIPASKCASRYGLLPSYDKAEKWTPPYRNGFCLTVLQRNIGVRDTIPSWCVMQECGLESLQFNWFSAAMRLYGPLTQCNSSTMKRVFKLTCNWAPDLLTAGPPTFFQPWKAWHNRTYVNRSCRTVSLLILVSFSWTLGTDI